MISRPVLWRSGVALVLLAVASGLLLPGARRAPDSFPLRLGVALQPNSQLVLVARDKGFFEKHGLKVEYTTYVSGKRALIDGLFAGQVDIVSASDLSVVDAALAGRDLRVVASIQSVASANSVVARRYRGIETIADLRGRRVATQERSSVHYFLHRALAFNGVPDDAVAIEFHPAEDLVERLVSGQVDAMAMREPMISQAVQQLGDEAVVMPAPWVYPQFELVVTRRATVERSSEMLRRVVRALIDAEHLVVEDPREAARIVGRALGVHPERQYADRNSVVPGVRLPQGAVAAFEEQAAWLVGRESDAFRRFDALGMFSSGALRSEREGSVSLIEPWELAND